MARRLRCVARMTLRHLSLARTLMLAGKIEVSDLSEYDNHCKADTVCRVDSPYWYLNQDHFVTLYKNKAVSIAVPE